MDITLSLSLISIIVALIACYISILAFGLKIGAKVQGSFSLSSSKSTSEKYVSKIVLENLKDKPVVIYKIYLKISHNYYLEIENFDSQPLILKPFEVYTTLYGPQDLYSFSMRKVSLGYMLSDNNINKEINLVTLDGLCKVKTIKKRFNIMNEHFKDARVIPIFINKTIYKGESYGSNILFLIDIFYINGHEEVLPIYNNSTSIFKNFDIPINSIKSKIDLYDFLEFNFDKFNILIDKFDVIDMKRIYDDKYKDYPPKTLPLPIYSRLDFNVTHYIRKLISKFKY